MAAGLHVVTEEEECRDLLDSKSLAKACRRAHWRVIEDIEVLIAQSRKAPPLPKSFGWSVSG